MGKGKKLSNPWIKPLALTWTDKLGMIRWDKVLEPKTGAKPTNGGEAR